MKKAKVTFSLKDQLFNKEKVEYISGLIKKVCPNFLSVEFEKEVVGKFPELELKQRISHISDMFQKYIWDKNNFEQRVNILLKSLPEEQENWTLDNNFWDFIFCPYSLFVAENWIEYIKCSPSLLSKRGDLEVSYERLDFCFNALEQMTSRFSCEDAIRYFLNNYEEETFAQMLKWSESENYHHRRLASEGSRQKLPWCQNINLDYKKTIAILDNLYCDESRYVTRSVANHLNDISKIDSDLVIDTLEKWKNFVGNNCSCSLQSKDLNYIISHSTRTLVKKWDTRTLEFLWYSSNPKITVNDFEIKNKTVKIGESLEFSFDINFIKQENLIIDYKIYFLAKSWKLLPKVFKIKKINNKVRSDYNDTLHIAKKHKLKIMTTKALYVWKHFLEIVINGKSFGKKNFKLQNKKN